MQNIARHTRALLGGVTTACLFLAGTAMADVTISGTVFDDRNHNGQRETDEPGIPNVQVSDGDKIVRTDTEGRYALETTTDIPNTVFVINPNGYMPTHDFFHPVSVASNTVDFGLAEDPRSAKDTFSFYHTADFQFGNPRDAVAQISGDLAAMESWAEHHDVAFYAICGDITTHGAPDDLQFFNEQFDALKRPVYRIFGGHDALVEMERPKMGNWVDAFGPYAYAWNYGGVHFIALVSEGYLSEAENERQMGWWKRDMADLPAGTPIVLLAHTPDQISAEIRTAVDAHNVVAFLFGHWHTHHNFDVDGVPFVVSSPMRPSDWGAFTKRTRVMTVAQGKLSSQSRVLEQEKRAVVLQPTGTVSNAGLEVRALVYDTAMEAKVVHAMIFNPDNQETDSVTLAKVDDWTWHGRLDAGLKPGNYAVDVVVNNDSTWTAGATFTVSREETASSTMALDWIVSMEADQPHRTTPLTIGNKVYFGISDGQVGATQAGVVCLDGATGAVVWRTRLPRSINAAMCSDGTTLFAVDGQGGIHALNVADGRIRWQADAYADTPFHEEQRYYWRTFLAPLTLADDTLFAAGSHVLAALSTTDGSKRWTNYNDLNRVPYPLAGLAPREGRVYFEDEYKVVALNQESGAVLWSKALKDYPDPVARERGTTAPVAMDDGVYVHHRSRLRKLDPVTGEQWWSAPSGGSLNYVGTPVIADSHVLVTNGGQILCFDRQTGERQWTFGTRAVNDTTLGPSQELRNGSTPLIVGDHVVLGGDDGYVYWLSLASGEKVWEYNTGTPIKASPVQVGHHVVVSNFAGNVFGFRYR